MNTTALPSVSASPASAVPAPAASCGSRTTKTTTADLSDRAWAILDPLILPPKPGGRPRRRDMRHILNGIFYLCRAHRPALALRAARVSALRTVYYQFRLWRHAGVWERIVMILRERLRVCLGRAPTSRAGGIDSCMW